MEPKTGTFRQAVGLLIIAALCGLFALTSGCGGKAPVFVSKTPETPPLVVGAITTSESPTWYALSAGALSVSVTGGVVPYSYSWTFSGTASPSLGQALGRIASPTVTTATPGTLHVALTVEDSSFPKQSGSMSADFTVVSPFDTLYITTDKKTYAVGDTVQITVNVWNIGHSMAQFDACRIAFTSPATGHYLMYPPGPGAITFKLGPNLISDPTGTDDGIFNVITKDPTNPRRLYQPIGLFIEPIESIPALNNQPGTVDGIVGTYDLRDFAVIWGPGGTSPFPEVVAGASGAAFTVFEKVQPSAAGQDIHIGFIGLEGATDRTYYTNQAGGATKLTFAHTQGVTIHIS